MLVTAPEHQLVCAQVAKKVDGTLPCISNTVTNETGEVIILLHWHGGSLRAVSSSGLSLKKGREILAHIQGGTARLLKGQENMRCEEQVRELGLLTLERAQGGPPCPLHSLEGGCREEGFGSLLPCLQ